MKSSEKIQKLIDRFIESLKETFSSIYGWLSMLFGAIIFTDKLKTIAFFFIFFLLLDYITGIIASWVEWRKKEGEPVEVYLVESEKLRASGVKIVGYGLILMFAFFLNVVVFSDHITLWGYMPPLSVFELALLGCTVIEFWSNIENIKRAGFDVVGKILNITKSFWTVFRNIKGEN